MAEVVKVSTEEMISTVNAYNTQKGAQQSAYSAMKSSVTSLHGPWMGDSAQAFQDQFAQFFSNLEQSEAKMQDAIDELRESANIFEETESATGNSARALDVGSSPFA